MKLYLPKSLDEEIKFRQEEARKLLEELVKDSLLELQFPVEMGFYLFGDDNVVREAIFYGYDEGFYTKIGEIRERIHQEYIERKEKCKFDKIAEFHAHTTPQLPINKRLINLFPDVHQALPDIPDGSCEPDTVCNISAYCFSLPDLKHYLERKNRKIEVLYCQPGKNYIAIDIPQMTMLDVIFY